MKETKHEINKTQEYVDRGYTSNYQMIEGRFTDLENEITFDSSEINIVDEYRYEGMSNPDDMSILYVISVEGKSKGTLILPFGPSGNSEMNEFMKDVSLNDLNKNKSELNKV